MKRNIILSILLTCSLTICAQEVSQRNKVMQLLNKNLSFYNPDEAIKLSLMSAENGEGWAMNALGIIYSKGLNGKYDYAEAMRWFKKAAESGYTNAWANLGLMYKDALGVTQDFVKSYQCFYKGSEYENSTCIYSLGYLYYKGLGCEQNYKKAVSLFQKGITLKSLGSMYMLGLCYRNGYGIEQNTDSARFWLQRAADKGYLFAKDELQAASPENADSNTQNNTSGMQKTKKNLNQNIQFYKVSHNAQINELAGEYEGYIIKYDYSGKHVISEKRLKLSLQTNGTKVTGKWIENDSLITSINAVYSDSVILFNNISITEKSHYFPKYPDQLRFQTALLQFINVDEEVYIAGNLTQYSENYREPEKPVYISLTKSQGLFKSKNFNTVEKSMLMPDNFTLKVYPNPFKNVCNVVFNLDAECDVAIRLFDMTGRELYCSEKTFFKGINTFLLNIDLYEGCYIIQLTANNTSKKSIIIKQ